MAKYNSSPLGEIHGKVNGIVAVKWKRTLVARKYAVPADRGSLLKYQQFKDGIPGVVFSFLQFNLRRVAINPLLKLARDHKEDWIYPIWTEAAKKRHLQMSGMNLLLKTNITNLYASFDKALEYDPITNSPDLTKLQLSIGDLEGTQSLTCTYKTDTGITDFSWNGQIFSNGNISDDVYGIILAKPLLQSIGREGNWEPQLTMYGPHRLTTPGVPPHPSTRQDGTGYTVIPADLDVADLTAALFFCQLAPNGKNEYSSTRASNVTAP